MEKKEIGTLIKLLDIFLKDKREYSTYDFDIIKIEHYYKFSGLYEHLDEIESQALIISKEFGFIKWLVENNRIDGNKYDEWLDKEGVDMEYPALEKLPHKEAISMVMIMLLAIQDNPIEFLIKLIQ